MAGNNDSVHIMDANGREIMVSFVRIDSMDWYPAKPFQIEKLYEMMKKYL